ncbi:hypothetical protein [Falsirhodobacter algicola]|uniref:hypothetical protein n=1 Tax=Falsirhodobacter algicola TaxID=2692330 RepID=UPI002013635E|nr:hypothetical protein [Falsirhodobacter algicola]
MHWFTADTHYGHDRIIDLCHRPFTDASAMNACMLVECRDRVQPSDDLWVLGDFIGGRTTDAQRRDIRTIYHAIPGRKHLVRGNYDEPGSVICHGIAMPILWSMDEDCSCAITQC